MRGARHRALHRLLARPAASSLGLAVLCNVCLDRGAFVHVPFLVHHRLVDFFQSLSGHWALFVWKGDAAEEKSAGVSSLRDDQIVVVVVAAVRLGALLLDGGVEVLEHAVGVPRHRRQLGHHAFLHNLGEVHRRVRLGRVGVSQISESLDARALRLPRLDGLLQLRADIRRALPRVLHDDRGVPQAGEDLVVRADQSLVLLHRVRLEVVAGRRLREPEVLLVVEHVVQMAGAEERALHVFIGDALFLDLRGGEPDAVGHIVRCARTFERECGHPSSF